jgi:hypothetical protein
MIRVMLSVAIAAALAMSQSACGAEAGSITPDQGIPMKLSIKVGERLLTATLADSASTKDFASLLPMILTLSDYASTEKVSELPRRLSTEGAPEGTTPTIGDITYYAPWGNLAIFYKDFGYSRGLIKLGRIDADIDVLRAPGPMQATIELVHGQ